MFAVKPTTPLKSNFAGERRLRSISGAGDNVTLRLRGRGLVRAAISREDKTVKSSVPVQGKDVNGSLISSSSLSSSSSSPSSSSASGEIEVRAVVTIRKKMKEKLTEKIEDQWEFFVNGIGQGIQIRLISEELDPVTKLGKSVESYVRGWLPRPSNHLHIVEYGGNFTVPRDFGCPGAVLVTNLQCKEFYLLEIVIHGFDKGPIFFPANTWIHSCKDNPGCRIIFRNQAYLPSQTPPGLKDLRQEDLRSIRGNGEGERKPHERIYDYDVYNDLGKPEKDDLARPVIGGTKRPYPRRCRTGRPPNKSDPRSESRIEKPHPVYVPRDETFEEIKQNTFSSGRLKALLHNLIPSLAASLSNSDIPFSCFTDIDKLYNDGFYLKDDEQNEGRSFAIAGKFKFMKQILSVKERLFKYEIPAVIRRDRFSWLRDNEFARQCLAGVNPVNIEILKEFPILSKLDPEVYGPPESAITKELIEQEINGMSVEKAIEEKRLFILDFHDMILPFTEKINSLPGRKTYASRTVFFRANTGALKPIAIELSLPPSRSSLRNKHVYTHGHDATTHWIWKLAKAHVCSNDAGVHQLVNHWLRTHACMEPYIIATHRQLSSMHPIYKLLHPHMRYTLEINALARQALINGGGIIEASFTPGKYAMELSSAAYKSWRFDMEALPADLLRRGMAVEDPSMLSVVKLVIEDYPYAADGLLIWSAIKEWVESYVEHYYSEPNSVTTDDELQAWWDEIKNKGHPDKRNEPWWPKLNTKEDLSGILTSMIWVASGQHAAINFGQYPFGGYMPKRPTLMRKLIPQENEQDYEKFILNPQHFFLSSLPTQLQATKIMAVQDTLSTHSADEEYLGQANPLHAHWTNDHEILESFNKFSARLQDIEEIINRRNKDSRLKNRSGAGIPPYELLLPSSGPGVTGRGIPNSISI